MSEPTLEDAHRRIRRIAGALRVLREEGHRWDSDLSDGIDLVAEEAEAVGMIIAELSATRSTIGDATK